MPRKQGHIWAGLRADLAHGEGGGCLVTPRPSACRGRPTPVNWILLICRAAHESTPPHLLTSRPRALLVLSQQSLSDNLKPTTFWPWFHGVHTSAVLALSSTFGGFSHAARVFGVCGHLQFAVQTAARGPNDEVNLSAGGQSGRLATLLLWAAVKRWKMEHIHLFCRCVAGESRGPTELCSGLLCLLPVTLFSFLTSPNQINMHYSNR